MSDELAAALGNSSLITPRSSLKLRAASSSVMTMSMLSHPMPVLRAVKRSPW